MKKLCVFFGGNSPEHDISIITGMQLSKNFKDKQNLEKIYISLENRLFLATKVVDLQTFSKKNLLKLKEVYISNGAVYAKNLINKKLFDIECAINCCHGGIGENGELSAFFAINNIKCTSANSLASAIAMNKNLTKHVLGDIVPTVKGVKISKDNINEVCKTINEDFSDQLIVKPNALGSSIGVRACDKQNYLEQVEAIFEMNDDALVEERIVDLIEYNQACFIDNNELILSAIEQPLTKSEFLTFADKYEHSSKGKGSDRVIPAKISKKLALEISAYTKKIYSFLNMSGVVRIDYIFDNKTKKLYFNEINTIPGSMAYYLFEPVGIDYITLIEKLVANAVEVKKSIYFDTHILTNKKI